MLAVMPKPNQQPEHDDEKPKRISKSFRILPELIEAMGNYRDAQDVAPTESAIIETALREFLEKRKYL